MHKKRLRNDFFSMNDQNAMRHVLAKAKKSIKSGNADQISKAFDLIVNVDPNAIRCVGCVNEDFGYCGLRNNDMSWEEIHRKFCVPAFIGKFEGKT